MQNDIEADFDSLEIINKELTRSEKRKINFKRRKWSLLFIIPAIIYILIFCYIPMYGILVAFQDFIPGDQILGSNTIWVGLDNFQRFFDAPNFIGIFINTFTLCLFGFIVGFPLPIIVALFLNSLRGKKMKKTLQTIFYAPHFISLVVLIGMMYLFFGSNGMINNLITKMGGEYLSIFLET